MIDNIYLWIMCSVFVGIVGFLMEANKKKKISTNIAAAFFGLMPVAGLVHFFVWTVPEGEINAVATLVGMVAGYVAVNIEDNFFMSGFYGLLDEKKH